MSPDPSSDLAPDDLLDAASLDDDERAISVLRAGRAESWLAYKLFTALKVGQLHDTENVAVAEANQTLARELDQYLLQRGRVSMLLVDECVYLNARLVRSGQSSHAWLHEFMSLLARRGIGGLLFAGAWGPEAAGTLVSAFKARGTNHEERCAATASACALILEPAVVTVLSPGEARDYVREEREAHLSSGERAAFYYARLTALAEVAYRAVGAGLSPDVYARNVRQTLRKLHGYMASDVFERRLLALTLHPALEPWAMATHASAVCVLSLAMGRLLGLPRGSLADLGFAAFFHDLGRAVRGRVSVRDKSAEDLESAHAHVLDGVAYAMRGHAYGSSELLRMIVAQEHHRQADGYPGGASQRQPHAFSAIVAVADAYHKLQQGVPWAPPVGQAKAITLLRDAPDRYDPAAVELLVNVLGRCPRGTILRLKDGSTVVSLDGCPRAGHLPMMRRLVLSDGTPDPKAPVAPLRAFDQILAEVDPAGAMFSEWSALIGEGTPGPPPAPPSDVDDVAGLISDSEDLVEEEDTDVRAVREIVEQLEKSIRFVRLYPRDHPFCVQALEQTLSMMRQFLEWKGNLTLSIRRDGVALGEAQVGAESGNATNLSYLLYPDGIRTLRFERGLDQRQVEDFVTTLARVDEGSTVDLMDALWQREFTHIDHVSFDQLSPGVIDRIHDPMLAPVVRRLQELVEPCQEALARLDVELGPWRDRIQASGDHGPPAAAADPAQAAAFLNTAAGSKRKGLLDRLRDPFLGDLLGRAADVVAWAAAEEFGAPEPEDVVRFLVGTVESALWKGDLTRAADLLAEGSTALRDNLNLVSLRLGRKHPVDLLARILQGQGAELADQGLRYLSYLTAAALPGLCRAYGRLVGADEVRQVLRSHLISRIDEAVEGIALLTRHADSRIVEESVQMLAHGAKGGRAARLLEELVADTTHRARAELARQALEEVSGEGERRACLTTIQRGDDREERLQAALRLREIGDAEDFEALRTLTQGRELLQRDEAEVEMILATLSALGGLRAVKVLQELSQRRGGLLNKQATVRVSRAATAALRELRDSDQGPVEAICPRCRFNNQPGALRCLSCGQRMVGGDAQRANPRPTQRPSPQPTQRPSQRQTKRLAREQVEPIDDGPKTARFRAGKVLDMGEPLEAPRANLSQSAEDQARAVLWLRCAPFDPIPLGSKPLVELGRRSDCDLVLNHNSVSRVHAVIRIVGGAAVVEDRSSYGTYVNGERVRSQELQPGDTLTIGPYDIEVLAEDVTASQDQEEGTRPLRTFATREAIGGRLEKVSLPEVLQQIELNQKTGTLEVFGEKHEGLLVVYEGRPMYAELGPLKDDAAVLQMIRMPKGTFSFTSKIEPGEMTMSSSLTAILLEAARAQDEDTQFG